MKSETNIQEVGRGGTIGWGIVGCGDVAGRKAGASFNENPYSRLVAVMRRDVEAAAAFAERHRAETWSTDADEVIGHPDVDIVYIATPPAFHLDYALRVADAGKACLVEKPAGRSLYELNRMHDAFRAAGLPLYVSYYRRHLERFRKVKALLDARGLGEVVSVDYRISKPPKSKPWTLNPEMSGGGYFYSISGHMLDLFDDWFGPLELTGASVRNALPEHVVEDAVSLSFQGRGGVVGSALWNFASSRSSDELIIDGTRGRIRMSGTSTSKPIRVEYSHKARVRISQSKPERVLSQVKQKMGLGVSESYRFADTPLPHGPMLAGITEELRLGRANGGNIETALRTAKMVDAALSPYYGGREGSFWERPQTFRSLQVQALERNRGPIPPDRQLSGEQLLAFDRDGYLGPFTCEADWDRLIIPVKKGRNPHMREADVLEVSAHPSIVRRVAQVMGRPNISLFKTRFVVKMPHSDMDVAWHQDSGERNGGYTPDGKPVPTVVVWLALDDVDLDNGGVEVIPGSHTRLVGDFDKRIRAELVEKGVVTQEDLARAVSVPLAKGEFFMFHGWLLHGSGPNRSGRRRAGLNIRFAPTGFEYDEEFVYIPLECGEFPVNDRIFRNEPWAA
jgi:predicted dehydrogenase